MVAASDPDAAGPISEAVRQALRPFAFEGEAEIIARTGSFLLSPSGTLRWSDGLFHLLGYSPGSVLPGEDKLLAAVHPEDRQRVRAAWADACRGQPEDVEYRILATGAAEPRHVRMSGRAEWEGEHLVHVLGALVDVTEARRNAIALEEALSLARAAEEVAQTGSFMVRVEPMEMIWTEGLRRITFVDEPNADMATHLERVHPEDRERQAAWWSKLVSDVSCSPLSVRMLAPDGSVRHLYTQAAVARSETDGVERIIGTTMDVTERVQLEEQLRHAAKMEAVGMLAAGVAHDFNNYLMVVESSLSTLTGCVDEDDADELIGAGRMALDRCMDLTRQLLAFARRQPFRPDRVDLRQVLSGFRELLAGIVGRRAQMRVQLCDVPLMSRVDPRHVERILANLAVNAADATAAASGRSGVIEVRARAVTLEQPERALPNDLPAGRYACLDVSDNGVGIAPAELPRIFDPYFTTKARGEGTGLGLSSVYGMASQNGGYVTVLALTPGTRLSVYFPLLE